MLASYDHSNTINLFALGALVAWLRGETAGEGIPEQGPRLPAPDVMLPKLASAEDVSPETWALVLRLNRFGDPAPGHPGQHVPPARPRAGFPAAIETALAPVQADGSLDRAITANRAARGSGRGCWRAPSRRGGRHAARIESGVAAFVEHAIGKMVTICRAIRVARGRLSS